MPTIQANLFEIINTLNEKGMTILLVEQNAKRALSISDEGYVLRLGEVVMQGASESLLENEDELKRHLLA